VPLSTPRPLPMSLMRKLHRRTEKVRPSAAGHEPGGCSHRLWSATGAPRGLLSIENSSSQGVSPAAAPAESRPVDVNRVSGDRGDHHRGHSPRGDRPAPKDRSGDPCWADSPRGCCFVDNSYYPPCSQRSPGPFSAAGSVAVTDVPPTPRGQRWVAAGWPDSPCHGRGSSTGQGRVRGTSRSSWVTWSGLSSSRALTPSSRIVRSISLRRMSIARSTPGLPPAIRP